MDESEIINGKIKLYRENYIEIFFILGKIVLFLEFYFE